MSDLSPQFDAAPKYPTHAIYNGKKARVDYYHGNGRFMLIDHQDERRLVHRDRLRFLPDKV